MISVELADALCDQIGGTNLCPNYASMLKKAQGLRKKRKRNEAASEPVVVSRLSLLTDARDAYVKKDVEGQGRLDTFYRFMERVDEKYMRRSLGQRDFHRSFLIACLPHVVGDDAWTKHREYYLTLFDEDTYKAEVLVTTPRRFGKTTAVAMFVAALMCCCPRKFKVFSCSLPKS